MWFLGLFYFIEKLFFGLYSYYSIVGVVMDVIIYVLL